MLFRRLTLYFFFNFPQISAQIGRDHLPTLSLSPPRSYLKVGESAVVDCESSEGPEVPIQWEKSGSRPLPSNVRTIKI